MLKIIFLCVAVPKDGKDGKESMKRKNLQEEVKET